MTPLLTDGQIRKHVFSFLILIKTLFPHLSNCHLPVCPLAYWHCTTTPSLTDGQRKRGEFEEISLNFFEAEPFSESGGQSYKILQL
jgi:hypothetical protein